LRPIVVGGQGRGGDPPLTSEREGLIVGTLRRKKTDRAVRFDPGYAQPRRSGLRNSKKKVWNVLAESDEKLFRGRWWAGRGKTALAGWASLLKRVGAGMGLEFADEVGLCWSHGDLYGGRGMARG